MLSQLPALYRLPSVSPSGKRAVYLKLSDAPTEVPPPIGVEGGEYVVPRKTMEFWLWEEGNSRSLGHLEHCDIGDDFWTADEEKVVLLEYGIPMPICEGALSPQAWLIDLSQNESYPLFPQPDFPAVQVYGFSPDGRQLLHGFYADSTGANLHLLDTSTFISKKLDASVDWAIQWIDDQSILVYYRGNLTTPPYKVGILDTETLDFIELVTGFDGLYIKHVSLSNDHKWLAFSTGDGQEQTGVWIIPLDSD